MSDTPERGPAGPQESERRPPEEASGLTVDPSVHAPPDLSVRGGLRGLFRKLVRPAPEPDRRGTRTEIPGRGPVHRSLLLAAAVAVATACGSDAPSATAEFASAEVAVDEPPATPTGDVVDILHGVEVPDPYRWLEDQESPETRAWIDEQNAHTDAVFAQIPGRERLTALASSLLEIEQRGTPTEEGGRYFFSARGPDDDLSILYFREGYEGEDRVLLDPHGMSADHTTSVGLRDVSEDGRHVVYAVREGGVDEVSLHIREVDTGQDLPDVFPTARYGSVSLTPDKSGLYYVKYGSQEPRVYYHRMGTDISEDVVYAVREGGVDEVSLYIREVDSGEDLPDVFPTARYGSVSLTPDKTGMYYVKYGSQEPRVYYHRMGTDISEDVEIFGEGYTQTHIIGANLSPDGGHMLATVIEGSSGPTELHLARLGPNGRPVGGWTEIIADGESRTFGDFAGDRLLLTTDRDAPNSKVVALALDDPSWESRIEIVPESEDRVIEGANPVGGYYFVSYLEDVQPKVAQYDTEGRVVREIEFETIGSTYGPSGEWGKDEAFITFTSFHVPTTSYRLSAETGETEVWFRTEIPIDTDSMEVRQVRYASKDGTEIPMFIVHRRGLELDGDNPTYLTGYGGFNLSRTPGFSSTAAAWVSLGGVYAIPNLRGGGEFGEQWHRAGMLESKQNVFDDFIAAAEFLIAEGYTSSEHLAIGGGSNGGLLVGAAMTQRPELFEAVVCTYPLLDMVRYHEFLVARFWVPEYGSSDDPDQFRYLHAYSPYHNVEEGTEYPATLFISGDGDTRVDPLHARKMAALVQAANGGEEPILLRYHTKAGHSGGQPVSEQIEQMVDTMSFLLWQVGGGD